MFYAEYLGTKLFDGATTSAVLSRVEFSQNSKVQIPVTVRDSAGAAQDMTGWTASVGIVGGTGIPTGTPGGPDLAAYTTGMAYSGTGVFTGVLDCNTDEMATFIGDVSVRRTKLAFKFVKNDGSARFECSCDCTMFAADIETGAAGVVSLGPVPFTVAEGQPQVTFAFPNCPAAADLIFVKLSGGPAVDFYIVNFNEDDTSQNTVTVTLAGNAAAGGQTFKALVVT